jgi:hypothetical protein
MIKLFSGSGSKSLGWRCLVIGVALSAVVCCHADDTQGDRSCRDGSAPPTNAASSGPAAGTQTSKPHGIKLSWTASVPASATARDAIAGYNIFRRESGKDCQQPGNSCQQLNIVLISETSCTDYSAEPGHTYIYQAQGVSHGKMVSGLSREAKAALP